MACYGVQPFDTLILEEFNRAVPYGIGGAKIGATIRRLRSGAILREGMDLELP